MEAKIKPTVIFLGTYPPVEEGISTFNQNLLQAIGKLANSSLSTKVAAVNFTGVDAYQYSDEVEWIIDKEYKKDYIEKAKEISQDERVAVVIVQHEYGLFGGREGSYIVEFLKRCKKPCITIMHTVLPEPTGPMYKVTQQVLKYSDAIAVLSVNSKRILEKLYPVEPEKVSVILHGIHPVLFRTPSQGKRRMKLEGKTVLTTFGLLSRNKGIDYVIRALPKVVEKHPDILYLILGQTHPLVRRKEGEKYRLELIRLVKRLKLQKHVRFYDKFLEYDDLLNFLQATDIYVATSLDANQSVSGTFSYALGSGRAVVTTAFSQAKEVIKNNTGRIVPIKDYAGYADAILELLGNPKRLLKMHRSAFAKTRSMLWNNVAADYLSLIEHISDRFTNGHLLLPKISLKHLKKMTTNVGLYQFAKYDVPMPELGYTIDDNARALILMNKLLETDFSRKDVLKFTRIYLHFLSACQMENGNFVNYLDDSRKPTPQNSEENLNDARARAIWALGVTAGNKLMPDLIRKKAQEMWDKTHPIIKSLVEIRSRTFVILGLCAYLENRKANDEFEIIFLKKHASELLRMYEKTATRDWQWFENRLTYANALIPMSLFKAYEITQNKEYLEVAERTLKFLISKTFEGYVYQPVGQKGWHFRNRRKNEFDQQPEDPASTAMALVTAYKTTGDEMYKLYAKKCFTWFLGNNILGIPVYNHTSGGTYDGLTPQGVNLNQGAESLVSYLLARVALGKIYKNGH